MKINKTYYQDKYVTIYNSNCLDMDIEPESVQCVVTSPPYWGLRKYDGEQDRIWGDCECEHEWETENKSMNYVQGNPEFARPHREKKNFVSQTGCCLKCGAWKGAYGLEPTPEMYVEHTVEILRKIRAVLRKDGVVFWNVGDSYFSGVTNSQGGASTKQESNAGSWFEPMKVESEVLKPKDLCLIPFRVAIAAQEDGWWVRSVIIWNKPNPMPESVKDRPTRSHEYILMLTKSAKYYWDIDAVREAYSPTVRWGGDKYNGAVKEYTSGEDAGLDRERSCYPNNGRNLRDVWTFPTQPFPEAHFAVFPEKLPETCIKAASKEGDIILDLFMGSGTTLKVASYLKRKSIGYDVSAKYCDMAIDRVKQGVLV